MERLTLEMTEAQVLSALYCYNVDFNDFETRELWGQKHGLNIVLVP